MHARQCQCVNFTCFNRNQRQTAMVLIAYAWAAAQGSSPANGNTSDKLPPHADNATDPPCGSAGCPCRLVSDAVTALIAGLVCSGSAAVARTTPRMRRISPGYARTTLRSGANGPCHLMMMR